MLINLTNHPSKNWSEKQKTEAIQQYKEIVDLPFPQIAPSASIEDVQKLAEEYVDKVKEMLGYTNVQVFDNKNNAVHIMGEMTFTHNVVHLLQQKVIKCIASTTERKSVEKDDGTKISVFTFVQFRNYRSEHELPF